MTNFSRATITRVARLLDGDEHATPLMNLSAWTKIPRKSFYNWTLPAGDSQYRGMPPSVKRLLAMIAYFAFTGQLDKQRRSEIEALEAAMADEEKFFKTARRVSKVLVTTQDDSPQGDNIVKRASRKEDGAVIGQGNGPTRGVKLDLPSGSKKRAGSNRTTRDGKTHSGDGSTSLGHRNGAGRIATSIS